MSGSFYCQEKQYNLKGTLKMARFTLPRDLYFGKDALENLKTLTGKKAIVVSGGSSMKKGGLS